MRIKRMQIKKKFALLLSSALLVTSMHVMPVEAAYSNQATGTEVQNAEASTNLSLEIASAPVTGQTHDAEWKNLNTEVTPDEASGTHKITENGKYYLSADINHTNSGAAVIIEAGVTATICLDGHTISATGTVISVPSGASLTLEDCSEPESKTGTGTVTGSGANVIDTDGSLVVNRVNVTNTNTDTSESHYAVHAGGYSDSVDSVVIKDSKLVGRSGSLHAESVNSIKIEATECTGKIFASKNTNMTISSSTVNEGSDNAIYYMNGQGGTITIRDSVLTTTSSAEYDAGLMCWSANDLIIINIENSTINAPENAIKVGAGEKIKISNSKLLCSNTGTPEMGCAIYYTVSDQNERNSLEVIGGEITGKEIDGVQKGWKTGINIYSSQSSNPEMNLTLSGDIKFGRTNPLNTDIAFPSSEKATINLHLNDLRTNDMVINAYSGELANVICDGDYSTYFKDPKYLFNSVAKDGGKYVLNCTPRGITAQPTTTNPQITVNDTADVSYQWYEVESYENAVTNETIVAFDKQLGRYEGGFWKPQQFIPNNPEVPYAYYLAVNLKAGDLVILENPDGTMESMKDILLCSYQRETMEKECREGKLYFTIPSDGDYLIGADFMSADENWPINADTRLKITVKGTKVTGEVAGSTKANLVTPRAGTFCCKATWAKGTAFEYSVLSDAVTVAGPIVPDETALTNIDIAVDTSKIPTLKVGDSIPNYGSQPAENSPFSFSDEVTYFNRPEEGGVTTAFGFGVYEYNEEGDYTDSQGNRLYSRPCCDDVADGTTLYSYYIELAPTAGYTFGDAVTICNGNNSHFVVEEIQSGTYIRIRYDMGTLQDIEDIKNESGGTTPEVDKILSLAKTNVTSKINELLVTNLTTDKDIENAIKTALLKEDETNTVGSEIKVNKTAAAIGTGGQITINVKLSLNGKDITFDLNKTIPALVGKNITVTVQGADNQSVSGATVKVMLGNTQKAEGTSASDGSCAFSNLPSGLYNIVITKDGVTKTAIANITTDDANVSAVLDTSSIGSSHLEVKETTVPETAAKVEETVVRNLDALAEALKETDPKVNSYKVEMAVEAKSDTQVSKSTHSEMVKEANKGETATENKATSIDFLDIVIQKTITKNSVEQEPELITDTGTTVMEIIIPFNFTGKTKVKVLREHNGVVEKFDETNTGADGTCKIDRGNGLIILYATKFSTYAVSYVAEGESAIEEPATPPAYTGGGSTPATVPATGITVETDKVELTKAGETAAIKAAIQPSNATDTKLTFTSSDEKVAKVDANGVITAVGSGTATITIKAANGITKTITVTVNIPSEENKDDSSSSEEEVVTPAKTAANSIAINKGLKVSQTGSKINVSWGKVSDADGYLVYAAYCGTDFGKAVKTIKDPSGVSTTITKINGKKLDLKKNFKVYVKAYKLVDGKKIAFGKSIVAHITGTKNTKNTNVKELKLTSKSKLVLAVGKTSKIKAKVVLGEAAKKQLSDAHAAQFRYASSDKKIATVDKNGKITAKAKGTCYIYVYARNGYAKKVTVTVK